MANKKYVIVQYQSPEPGTLCPVVAADNNKMIKSFQEEGYKIAGRISCDEGFIPDFVMVGVIPK